jgi:hypothetical protein
MRAGWIFSPRVDLAVFGGSAAASLALLGAGVALGIADTPPWAWVIAILLVDVAHVWSTGLVVYLDPVERARRPLLYALTPLLCWGLGVILYSEGELVFWRALAYLAVFHFVRQQAGWVVLYRARAGERDRAGAWLDLAAVHAATLYPLLHWHVHLPREFDWFIDGDFAPLPGWLLAIATPAYAAILGAWVARTALQWTRGLGNPGKDLLIATTTICWYVGIVATDADYAFTVTNVLIHGIPYLVLVHRYGRAIAPQAPRARALQLLAASPVVFLAAVWAVASLEELAWLGAGRWPMWLVPLLAVPQMTHYVLDGFLWRRRSNPRVAAALGRMLE